VAEFVEFLADLRPEVERALDRLLPAESVEPVRLHAAMRYSVFAGGKRVRPGLVVLGGEIYGAPRQTLLPAAAAMEMIHTFSLVHDDLPALDDDDLRRGQPSSHVRFGEGVAILAGDGLYAEAFALVLGEQQGDPRRVLASVRELADATGVRGMVGGQYIDIEGASDLRRLHELKTGRLIGASVGCVLLLVDRDQTATLAYRSFAAELGVLFQIVDDILDVTGTDDALGKPSGSDERHGKRTYVSEFGLDRARELAADSHRKARAALAQASAEGDGTQELEQITDFIVTRTS